MAVAAGGPPSGVVTFLFTDIEGSTRRWEADAEGMRAALSAHDDVVSHAIDAHDGFLFSRTGDGVVAAFASPKSAVDAAVAAQRALQLPVRMGLATGAAELRDGDYFGVVLNRAARVMSAGHGGQILLADSTANQLSGLDLLDLGLRRLRDVPTAVRIFQLQAPGLRSEFPPIKVLDATPGNLRPGVTSFVGRELDLVELKSAVRGHRLVTLTGPGGVGKTRLATETAAALVNEFADGVWLFELAAVNDASAVPDAVAAVLNITQQPGKSLQDSIAVAQHGRTRLLVFDNCEHVLDAAADLIEAILDQSETVKVLATSRERLGLGDEQLWPVYSLEVGDGIDSEAVALFVERARSVWPQFALTEPDAVIDVCRHLDGLPLAIELAASRMASMTANEVRDRLDHRFHLLVGSRRDVPHHQSLRHAVHWSYDLLRDAEKALLERCSVFAGGFDLQSACAIGGFADEYLVLDLLDALARKSLVVVNQTAGHTRYSMLETIRHFAGEQLVKSGAADKVRDAHAHHFAERESEIMMLWDSPQQRDAYAWFGTELANLRVAFRWAADRNLDDAAAIATYAGILGYIVENLEPITWTEELLDAALASDHPRLATLYVLSSMCGLKGRIADAVRYRDAAMAEMTRGAEVLFGFECLLGRLYLLTRDGEGWANWCRPRLAAGHDVRGLLRAAFVLCQMIASVADEALAAANGLIEVGEATHNPHAITFTLLAYGFAHRDVAPLVALDALRRSRAIAHDNGVRANESFAAMSLGRLEVEHGDPIAALDYVTLGIRHYYDSGNTAQIRMPLACLAAVLDRLGHYEPAATISGFTVDPLISFAVPEIDDAVMHLRGVLGDDAYESLAAVGAAMTLSAMATYAYDQADQARTLLCNN